MFKKKSPEAVVENPIRVKLEEALEQLEKSETAYSAIHGVNKFDRDNWSKKIYSAEKFLHHPKCKSPEHVKTLLKMAIASYEVAMKDAQESKLQLEKIQGYKDEIREAITKMNTPDDMSDTLKHRLKVIGSSPAVLSGNSRTVEIEDEETIFHNLRGTLLAVDALVSLQKEGIAA